MVLEPIEPVAPSSVTDFGTRARSGRAGFCCVFFTWPTIRGLPYQQAAGRSIGPLPKQADQERNQRCDQKAVETVHQSSVTGDQAARILGAKTPFDRGFEQVASLGED